MSRRLLLVAPLLLGAALPGCDDRGARLEEDLYVEAMARITYAEIRLFEPAREDSARAAILEELGVSAADLVAFAERVGGDVRRVHEIWGRIRDRVDSLEAADGGAPHSRPGIGPPSAPP